MHPWKRAHALAKGRQHAHAVARQHEKRRRKRPQKSDHSHSLLSRAERQRSTLWPCLTGRSACECVLENRDFLVCESKQCSWMLAYMCGSEEEKRVFFWDDFCARMCVLRQSWIGAGILRCWSFKCTYKITSRITIVCPVQGFHPTKTNACPSPK